MRKEPEKKSTKRSSLRYKALHPEVNLRSRYKEIKDLSSYKDQLNEEELDWLDRFSHEYVCGNFNHGGEVLHDTPELKKSCYANNNRRNRDISSQQEAVNALESVEGMQSNWKKEQELNNALKNNIFDKIKKRKTKTKKEKLYDKNQEDIKYIFETNDSMCDK